MDFFLKENPSFIEKYKFFLSIKDKSILHECIDLNEHMNIMNLDMLKRLKKTKFFKSKELKIILKRIIKNESNGIERQIYKAITHQKIFFDDIKIKISFYEQLGKYRKYFRNKSKEIDFLLADLLYRHLNYEERIEDLVIKLIDNLHFLDKAFYILIFGEILNSTYIRKYVEYLNTNLPHSIKLQILILSILPKNDFYSLIAFNLLLGTPSEKIQVLRAIDGVVDYNDLVKSMLIECSKDMISINQYYLSFLTLLEMIPLKSKNKLFALFSLLRVFLYEKKYEFFNIVLKLIHKYDISSPELNIYNTFKDFIDKKKDLKCLKKELEGYEDENIFAIYSFDQITERIENY